MSDDELTPERAAALTAAVDIEAPPPDGEPVALLLFGTNQAAPAQLAAARYHVGTARWRSRPAASTGTPASSRAASSPASSPGQASRQM